MKRLIKLKKSNLHNIIKESVKKIIKEWEGDPYSLDADEIYGDKATREDSYNQRMQMMDDEWEMRNRRLRQKYPGKSEEWYEAMIDTFYENKEGEKTIEEENGGGATSCANVMQTGSGKLGTNPEAGQYTVPFGADKETADRTPGKVAMGGKAKWNVNNGNVQRRPIYNPKSGK